MSKDAFLAGGDYTLVVVDMQPEFYASECERTQWHVLDQIRVARENGAAIVIVELFSPWGMYEESPTLGSILQAVVGYDRFGLTTKPWNDGSSEIMKKCLEYGFSRDRFRVVGVNTTACVIETASGLADLNVSEVDIYLPACNQASDMDDIDLYEDHLKPNTRLNRGILIGTKEIGSEPMGHDVSGAA